MADLLREEMLLCRLVAAFMAVMIRQFRKLMADSGNRPGKIS